MQGRPPGETGNLKKEVAGFPIQPSGMTVLGIKRPHCHRMNTNQLSASPSHITTLSFQDAEKSVVLSAYRLQYGISPLYRFSYLALPCLKAFHADFKNLKIKILLIA